MRTLLVALLGTSVGTGAWAQDTSEEEGAPEAEGDEGMIEMTKDSGGVLVGVDLAFGKVTGTPGNHIGVGIGGDVWSGYEIAVGTVGLIPRLKIGYENFLEKDKNGGSLITVYPGFLVAVHVGNVAPWAGIGLGLGSLDQDKLQVKRENKFGFEFGFGVNYQISDATAVGGFFAYDAIFTPGQSVKVVFLGAGTQFKF